MVKSTLSSFFGWIIPRSQHSLLAPLPHGPVGAPTIVTHHIKALIQLKKGIANLPQTSVVVVSQMATVDKL
ncbi:MAG: hypothetical protein IMF11_17545, partial [Proteobacteria bacterium]|nr:hypothetical protein [Pseudomonadota bacterium]